MSFFRLGNRYISLLKIFRANISSIDAQKNATTGGMRVCVCSPTKILFDSYASQIDVNTSSGSFGVLPSHVPVIFPLSPGLLTIMSPEKVVEIVVASGYFSIHEDSKVDIFVSEAAYRDEIKLDLVKDATDYFNNMMNKTNDDEQKKYANIALKSIEEYAKLAKN